MSAFKSIARQWARRAIEGALAANKRTRVPATLVTAQRILVIFDGRDAGVATDVEAFAERWQREGKQVQLFKLIEKDKTDPQGFSEKETSWSDVPKADVTARCIKLSADLLILFNPADLSALHFLATVQTAGMKISTSSSLVTDADLVFERDGNDFAAFMREVEDLMKNILV